MLFGSGDNLQLSSTVTYTMLPDCECGCFFNQSSGYIVTSSLTDCPSERIWLIRVSDELLVRLTFIRFDAQRGTVRVHDGDSSLSNLLVQIHGGSAVLPQPLTSAGNIIRVEYILPSTQPSGMDVVTGGFVALYAAVSTYGSCYLQER